MPKITLVLVDDHQLVLDAWMAMLNDDARFWVLGCVKEATAAIKMVSECKPDVVLCDINLAPLDGIAITAALREQAPCAKVLAVSVHNLPSYAKKMLQVGAYGYVTKNSSVDELKRAILAVSEGKRYICDEIKDRLVMTGLEDRDAGVRLEKLTKKELDVIQAVKQGLSSKEIAAKLDIALKTVEVHRYNILRKLNLRNTAALINFINTHGLL